MAQKKKALKKPSVIRSLISNKSYWAIILILIVVMAVLEATNTTHIFHKSKAVSGIIPSKKITQPVQSDNNNKDSNVTSPDVQSSSTNSSQTQSSGNKENTSTSTSQNNFLEPYGTFVSNHHPNLDNSPAPSKEESVCQTTPGASCYIQFTNNGVVKKLPSQVTNKDGVAIWDWDVNNAGLTVGSWQILAVATMNGTSKSTSDPLSLEVGP